MKVSRGNRMRGFSLLELLLVLAVVFVVTAMAIPHMLASVEQYRLRGKAVALEDMLQRARSIAARSNTPAGVGLTGSTFSILSNSADAGQLRIVLPGNMSVQTTGMPGSLSANTMGISAASTITVAGANTPAYFSARGLPCPYNSSAKTCGASAVPQAYVYYLRDTAYLGTKGWAAVSVTPSGRTKAWTWDGTVWK